MSKLIAALVVAALIFIPAAMAQPLKAYTLTLSPAEISYIAAQLRERPFKEVAPLLNAIQAQIDAQDREATEKAEKPKATSSNAVAPKSPSAAHPIPAPR